MAIYTGITENGLYGHEVDAESARQAAAIYVRLLEEECGKSMLGEEGMCVVYVSKVPESKWERLRSWNAYTVRGEVSIRYIAEHGVIIQEGEE